MASQAKIIQKRAQGPGGTRSFSKRHVLSLSLIISFALVGGVAMLWLTRAAPGAEAPDKFATLPVGARLPSEAECASWVRPAAEIRPGNTVYNNDTPVGGNYLNPRITGNFKGTTDEIIQWAACKWGIDEDVLRAQAVQESYWRQNALGDWAGDSALCSNLFPVGSYQPQHVGDHARSNQCPESYGILQVRWHYHKSGFYSSTTENPSTLTNNAIYSTAYNIDYYGHIFRNCYNGNETWLNSFERGQDYAAGDMWGCLGLWFAGRWRTAPALQYIASVQNNLSSRTWEQSYFLNYQYDGLVRTREVTETPPDLNPGDINGDGRVDIFDLSGLLANWGRTNATRSQGDLTGDGVVNIFDFSRLLRYWGL